MMLASGERGYGSQLYLYQSNNLLDWKPVGTLLDVEAGSRISPRGNLKFGMNFECASFFSIGSNDYLTLGVEEDQDSTKHNCRYALWLCGNLILDNGKPKFVIKSHGLLDHGISYAPHIVWDSENRLIQLGWADETAKSHIITRQGWAGCLAYPRELYEISRPICKVPKDDDIWTMVSTSGRMTTLGIRPAPQMTSLRQDLTPSSLRSFTGMKSTNFALEATFSQLSGNEIFEFHVRKSPCSTEFTKIILDISNSSIIVDRSHSSSENLGTSSPDSGPFHLLPNEDLHIQIFVDNSVLEVYANDRFALTSRVYPSLEESIGVSYDFGGFDEARVRFECWESLENAWPVREWIESSLEELHQFPQVENEKSGIDRTGVVGDAVS
jgi:beta-fructofuranosidase